MERNKKRVNHKNKRILENLYLEYIYVSFVAVPTNLTDQVSCKIYALWRNVYLHIKMEDMIYSKLASMTSISKMSMC